MKTIDFMFDYGAYCLWTKNENDDIRNPDILETMCGTDLEKKFDQI